MSRHTTGQKRDKSPVPADASLPRSYFLGANPYNTYACPIRSTGWKLNVEEGGRGGYSYQHRPLNITNSLSQIFSTKSLLPNSIYTRAGGALVGCGLFDRQCRGCAAGAANRV